MRKSQWILVGVAVIVLLVLSGVIRLSPLGSGSGWEFDYALSETKVNGEGITSDGQTTPPVTVTGGGGTDFWYTMASLISGDAYHQLIDVDGAPVSNWLMNIHDGLCPNLDISMSQVWRVNEFGEQIAMTAPCEYEYIVGDDTYYLYNYAFSIKFETVSRAFTAINQVGAAYTTAESGQLDGYTDITVYMQETIFGDVEGEFMSATIKDVGSNLQPLLEGGYVFAVYPSATLSAPNTAIEIQNRVKTDTDYSCTMRVPFSLQNGLTRIDLGQNYVPANVWVRLTILTELLLKEPLNIGQQGDNNDGGTPPNYTPPFDLRLVALIAFGFIVLVVVLYFWSRSKGKQPVHVNVGYRGYNKGYNYTWSVM